MDLKKTIRNVPDFPKKGIGFKDITTLLKDKDAFRQAIHEMCNPYRDETIDMIVGIESRCFIFGGAMAVELGCGFVPVRKPGKLPAETVNEEYALEYGTDAVEIQKDAIKNGMKLLIVDDLLATGGTAEAVTKLVERLGGDIVGIAFLIELNFLGGREKLLDYPIHVLIGFDDD